MSSQGPARRLHTHGFTKCRGPRESSDSGGLCALLAGRHHHVDVRPGKVASPPQRALRLTSGLRGRPPRRVRSRGASSSKQAAHRPTAARDTSPTRMTRIALTRATPATPIVRPSCSLPSSLRVYRKVRCGSDAPSQCRHAQCTSGSLDEFGFAGARNTLYLEFPWAVADLPAAS